MDPISEHISWYEFCQSSQTAREQNIDNECTDPQIIANAKLVAENCFEPIRAHFGIPLPVSSFYRCPELNKAVGGVPDSQHQFGQAIDIEAGPDMNIEIFNWAKENLNYDQLLNEYPDADGKPTWVHISYVSPEKNRHQAIYITRGLQKP